MIRWIASYPKSGNTWVRIFLLSYEYPDYTPNDSMEIFNHKQDIDLYVYNKVSPIQLNKLTLDEVRLLRGAALVHHMREAFGKTSGPMYLKTHSANITVNNAAWIPPEITENSIYIIRDPRDVVISFADHLGEPIDQTITRISDPQQELHSKDTNLHQPITSWSLNVKSWLRDLPFNQFAIRYEDLIADPEHWFKKVLSFQGFIFNQESFDRAMRMSSFDSLSAKENEQNSPRSTHQKKFFREGKAGGWQDVLTGKQALQIEKIHEETMKTCAYL